MKKQLKDVCEGFTKNIAQKDLSENNGKYPIFGASGIIKTIDFYISDKPYIGIVKDGSGVGRTNKYPAKSSLLGTMQYILPNQGIDLDYLMYGIRSLHLGENYSGAAIPHIYFKVYKNRTLDFPELAEQKQRSIVLNKIQDAINVKEKQLFELENIIQSEFVEMFGENPVESGKWKVETLGEIGKVSMCKRILREQTTPEGDIPFYKIGTFGKKADAYISKELYNEFKSRYSYPKKGSILISASGTIGRAVVFDGEPAYFQDSNIVWIDNDETKVLNSFLQFWYGTNPWKITQGGTISRLYNSNISEANVIIPPLEVQQSFAAFVQQIDKSKFVLQQQLQFIKKYVIMTSWRKICFYTTVAM